MKKTLFRGFVAIALTAPLAAGLLTRVAAQQGGRVDPSLYSGLRWRMLGPFRGGRVNGVTGVPGQPNVFYMGSVGGGVWKTTNAGRTWLPIFDSQPIASIGAVAVAPSRPDVVYVGTGEADMRSQISYGNGMYKSTDAGKTWTHIGLEPTRQIGKVIVDPRDPNVVFVAALGHVYGANPDRGVYRTATAAPRGRRCCSRATTSARSISTSIRPRRRRSTPSLWNTRRPPWSIYPPSYGPGQRPLQVDRRRSQLAAAHLGLPSDGLGRIGVAVAPDQPQPRLRIVDAKEGGLFRSDDAGRDVREGVERRAHLGSRLVLRQDRRRSEERDLVYVSNTGVYRIARRRPHVRRAVQGIARRRRLSPADGSRGGLQPHDSSAAIRAR
jgi:hypothetical protein